MKNIYKIILGILTILFLSIIIINTYKISSTIFSGTHYMRLPSKFYVKKNIEFHNKLETIQAGSFLLKIDTFSFDSKEEIQKYITNKKPNDGISVIFFNIKKVSKILDLDSKKKYFALSDTVIVNKSQLDSSYFTQIDEGVYIGFVEPNGATDRGGIKAGDILITLNGFKMKMNTSSESESLDIESLKFLRNLPKGEPIEYKVLRNNNYEFKNVYLSQFGLPTGFLITLICGLSIFAFGVFLLITGKNGSGYFLTTFVFILTGFQISSAYSIAPPDFDFYSWLKELINVTSVLFITPLICHSLMYFPINNKNITNKKILVFLTYLFSIISFILFSYWYINDYKLVNNRVLSYLMYSTILYFVIINFIYKEKISTPEIILSRKIKLVWLVFVLIVVFPEIVSFFNPSSGLREILSYTFLSWIVIPLVYTYIIRKYKYFGIKLNLKLTKQYTVVSLFWKGIISVVFLFLVYYLAINNLNLPRIIFSSSTVEITSLSATSENYSTYNKIFYLIVIVLSGTILFYLSKYVQKYLDKKFYRGKLDYKTAQDKLSKFLEKKFTIESLAKVIVENIALLANLKATGVLFYQHKNPEAKQRTIYCYNNTKKSCCDLEIDQHIIDSLSLISGRIPTENLPLNISVFLKENNFHNILPIKKGDILLGTLFIGEKLSETPLNKDDFEFLSSLLLSSSIAVENAFLYEEVAEQERIKKELEIARNIQVASLPQNVPLVPGLEIAATSIPALEVGGDFYDFLNGQINQSTILLGDVSGKGTSAALYMSKVQGIFQTLHEFRLSPSKLLIRANKLLYKHIDSKSYVTVSCANFDTTKKVINYARAGHLPLYQYSQKTGEIKVFQPSGIGLGLSDVELFDSSIQEIVIPYTVGDIFLFVSDGITDSLNKNGDQYGEERLLEVLKSNQSKSSSLILSEILNTIKTFSAGANQFDDITLVIVKSVA